VAEAELAEKRAELILHLLRMWEQLGLSPNEEALCNAVACFPLRGSHSEEDKERLNRFVLVAEEWLGQCEWKWNTKTTPPVRSTELRNAESRALLHGGDPLAALRKIRKNIHRSPGDTSNRSAEESYPVNSHTASILLSAYTEIRAQSLLEDTEEAGYDRAGKSTGQLSAELSACCPHRDLEQLLSMMSSGRAASTSPTSREVCLLYTKLLQTGYVTESDAVRAIAKKTTKHDSNIADSRFFSVALTCAEEMLDIDLARELLVLAKERKMDHIWHYNTVLALLEGKGDLFNSGNGRGIHGSDTDGSDVETDWYAVAVNLFRTLKNPDEVSHALAVRSAWKKAVRGGSQKQADKVDRSVATSYSSKVESLKQADLSEPLQLYQEMLQRGKARHWKRKSSGPESGELMMDLHQYSVETALCAVAHVVETERYFGELGKQTRLGSDIDCTDAASASDVESVEGKEHGNEPVKGNKSLTIITGAGLHSDVFLDPLVKPRVVEMIETRYAGILDVSPHPTNRGRILVGRVSEL
jgi:hypothetical protein